MSVIALLNRKGGVGKTTLAVALADYLSSMYNRSVLLIDLDAQCDLSLTCIGDDRWQELARQRMTVADILDDEVKGLQPQVHPESLSRIIDAKRVSLIVGTPRLPEIDPEATTQDHGRQTQGGSPYLVLQRALTGCVKEYDYTLIDCPPSLNNTMMNGLALSDGYLTPVLPNHMSAHGIEQFGARITTLGETIGRRIKRHGTIVNRFDSRSGAHRAAVAALQRNPEAQPVWSARVRVGADIPQAWTGPAPLTLTDRWGSLHEDLAALALEFVRRIP